MDHVGLFLARLILTPMLLCICNKYDLGRARAKKKILLIISIPLGIRLDILEEVPSADTDGRGIH